MSIQTELTRITNAKAAIKTAIEGKGVTVPSGTLLDGMAALIEAIEVGGSSDYTPFELVTMGTIIPTEDTDNLAIPIPDNIGTNTLRAIWLIANNSIDDYAGSIDLRYQISWYISILGRYNYTRTTSLRGSNQMYAPDNIYTYNCIDGNNIKVVVDSDNKDTDLANKIMRSVQSNYDTKKYITVEFK